MMTVASAPWDFLQQNIGDRFSNNIGNSYDNHFGTFRIHTGAISSC